MSRTLKVMGNHVKFVHLVLLLVSEEAKTHDFHFFRSMHNKAIIEGFGGKRVLSILLKSELCQKHSKFRMQFCLGVLNNVLYVFLLKFVFVVMSAHDCKDGNSAKY